MTEAGFFAGNSLKPQPASCTSIGLLTDLWYFGFTNAA